jgi:hypothetical protein
MDNGAVLFRIEDAEALRVTLCNVGPRLQQDDLVLVVLYPNGYITPAHEMIWAVIILARESGGLVVGQTVNLEDIR